jgi:hypothetical protein
MKKIVSALSLAVVTCAVMGLVFSSCKKSSNTIAPPTLIGGYASSDSVASGNLIGYWPFDGNANDVKGGQTGTTTGGATYTTGIRGQAYQGSAGGYATVPANSALKNLGSYSTSVWFKLPAQPATTPQNDPAGIFFVGSQNAPNELMMEIESYNPKGLDSVRVHHGFNNIGAPAWQQFVMESFDTMALNKWVHQVTTYDGASSTYTVYENGTAIGNSSAFGQNVTPTTIYTDGNKTSLMGNMNFTSDPPTQVILGTWPAGLFGVSSSLGSNGGFLGQMDELRIYNKALSASEVNGLYLNGKAGR